MIGGPSIGLPFPTNPYPAQPAIPGVSSQVWTNKFFLARATLWQIPPGWWEIACGSHSQVVYKDPVSLTFVAMCAVGGNKLVNSDGSNFYVFNNSGTPSQIATITGAGSGYVQATTTVTASAGGSTWTPLVDGTLTSFTVGNDRFGTAGGSNFTIPPIVIVQAPAAPGIQATGLAVLSAGAVASITVENAGAGYLSAPGVFLLPDPSDPNIGIITVPAVTTTLAAASGAITGILQTYHGTSQGSAPTLTIGGAGSSGTATVAIATAAGDDTITVTWLGGGG